MGPATAMLADHFELIVRSDTELNCLPVDYLARLLPF
jgi:hypothetical protein